MNNIERHQHRYERRMIRRANNIKKRCEELGGIEKIFSFHNMMYYGRKCCNGVRWKESVQYFEINMFMRTAKNIRTIMDEVWCGSKCSHFVINERGKERIIDAPYIKDRQIHKCESNELLIPLYQNTIIAANGASRKGRGLHWHFRLMKKHIVRFFRKYGKTGYVLLIDLKGFFPNVPLKVLYDRHKKYIPDAKLKWIADKVVDCSPHTDSQHGMPLGIEPSQQEMIAAPSLIDHFIKCQLRIKEMAHYMDDYYMFLPTKEKAKEVFEKIVEKFENNGFVVNRNKCHIIPMTRPFKWCKCKFTITDTGRIIMNGNRDGAKRMRRKLRVFRKRLDAGVVSFKYIKETFYSQIAYYKIYNDHGRVLRLKRFFYALFKKEIEQENPVLIVINAKNNNTEQSDISNLYPFNMDCSDIHVEYSATGTPMYVSEVRVYNDGDYQT